MKVGRRLWLVMVVALGSIGCRAAGTGTLSLFPRTPLTQGTLDVEEYVAQHNRNAESIQSLVAKPSIKASTRLRPQVHLDGRMALERPRNFRMELSSFGQSRADIGSNREKFWYWVSGEPSIYWCKYADLETTSLPMTYRPDWIIEAMGLQTISAVEARQIHAKKGPLPDTTALVFPVTQNGSESYQRTLIVSNRERRIKQLRIYSAKSPTQLIAQADPSKYKDYPVKGEDSSVSKDTCYLPDNLVLDWKRDPAMKLEVELLEVELNQFDPSRREILFNEPPFEGYQRKNLAELSRGARPAGSRNSTRRSLPPPSSRGGVELGRPAPLTEDDGPVVPKLGTATAPASSTPPPDLPPLESLVGSPLPSAPESPTLRAARADQYPPSGLTIER
jgi:hypothetical protein